MPVRVRPQVPLLIFHNPYYILKLTCNGEIMQNNLFDNLKLIKEKINQEEKMSKDKLIEVEKQEKEQKLQDQFVRFMKESGIKKLS